VEFPSDQARLAAQLLLRLAEKLDDRALNAIEPDLEPEAFRQLLRRLAASLDPSEEEPKAPLPSLPSKRVRRVRLFTDGASRGNPGLAGAGVVVLDEAGRELAARAEFLGTCTNNVAEYKALLLGLEEAERLAAREIELFLDSELVVRQIEGVYRVKNPGLKPLFDQAKERLRRFDKVTINHVPREENQRADQLANQAIDSRHREV